jgi:hypothetical protein
MRLVRCCCFAFASMFILAGASFAQDTNFAHGPQYLITGSTMFLRSIATPSESLQAPLENPYVVNTDGSVSTDLVAAHPDIPRPDLQPIYWGEPKTANNASEIEITSPELPPNLPASILDSGVTAAAVPGFSSATGSETTLGAAAAFWKDHASHVSHVYTDADVERLHNN